jgi:hypothetical protein
VSENCFHCGQDIEKERIEFDEKLFCCTGCKSVYEILNLNDLGNFYELNKRAGIRPGDDSSNQFDYLDTQDIFDKITDFSEGNTSLVTFKIPVIHCSSCIWLLESLHTLNPNIKYSQVNFTRKTLQISFNHKELKLSELANFLTNLGYKPVISLETAEKNEENLDKILTRENLMNDVISSINAAEMARRKFRDIAVISGMVVQNFPGQQRSNKSLQSSAGLIFKVLEDHDPNHFLVRQAYTEVFNMQLQEQRLVEAFKRIEKSKIILKFANSFTPLSFPIKVDSLRQTLTSEDLDMRIQKLIQQAKKLK